VKARSNPLGPFPRMRRTLAGGASSAGGEGRDGGAPPLSPSPNGGGGEREGMISPIRPLPPDAPDARRRRQQRRGGRTGWGRSWERRGWKRISVDNSQISAMLFVGMGDLCGRCALPVVSVVWLRSDPSSRSSAWKIFRTFYSMQCNAMASGRLTHTKQDRSIYPIARKGDRAKMANRRERPGPRFAGRDGWAGSGE
jgi:hypothetical protein